MNIPCRIHSSYGCASCCSSFFSMTAALRRPSTNIWVCLLRRIWYWSSSSQDAYIQRDRTWMVIQVWFGLLRPMMTPQPSSNESLRYTICPSLWDSSRHRPADRGAWGATKLLPAPNSWATNQTTTSSTQLWSDL